jgi:predicted nucleic acid-binding protein
LQSELDPGESAAIVLALEVGADLILADERKGRRKAAEMGLEVVGLLGVINEAKRRGLIPACRPVLDALEKEARFWISPRLRDRFLALTNE